LIISVGHTNVKSNGYQNSTTFSTTFGKAIPYQYTGIRSLQTFGNVSAFNVPKFTVPKMTVRFNTTDNSVARVGGTAPQFEAEALVGTEFKKVKLSDYQGRYVVLFWYPFDFTFVCPTEIINFSEKASEFKANNCEVIGASCDSKFTHLAWANTPRKEGGIGQLNIPLISDFNKELATKYGALFLGNGFPLRATYIIDDKQRIRHISMNDPPVGRNVDEVLRIVQACQFTDKHGEVCPAGWKPGSASMKADPVKSKEYFQKHNK